MFPLYLNTYQEWVLSTEAAMFFIVAQTGQTKPFEFLWQLKPPQVLMYGKGGWGEGYSAATCNLTTRCH